MICLRLTLINVIYLPQKILQKTVCDYRRDNPEALDVDIAKHFNIGIDATRTYLLKR